MTTDEKIAILVDVLGRIIDYSRNQIGNEVHLTLLNMLAKIKDADNG